VNTIMIEQRGHESALSSCPTPAAALAAAAPALARPRAAAPGYPLLPAVTALQGTDLPVAGQIDAVQIDAVQLVSDVPTMFVQPHPGDTARRPPA
jgi:hypothetical protein